jgi:hypothetical protein
MVVWAAPVPSVIRTMTFWPPGAPTDFLGAAAALLGATVRKVKRKNPTTAGIHPLGKTAFDTVGIPLSRIGYYDLQTATVRMYTINRLEIK